MIFGSNREQLRQMYVDTLHKMRSGQPLTALEGQIADVIEMHPEYQPFLLDADKARQMEFLPEFGQTNPFLHMGLHLGLREQLSTNRPPGLRQLFEQLLRASDDRHTAEHEAMDCLAEALWLAQKQGRPPQDDEYLACLQSKLNKRRIK
jgi:hypothetical protein